MDHQPSLFAASPFERLTFLVLDTETTGIAPATDRVVQIAGVWVRGGEILHTAEALVNPGCSIPPEASEVHHLTDRHVAGAEPLSVVLPRLLAEHPFEAFAAHNADFDFGFVPSGGLPVLCTLRVARRLWDFKRNTNQYLRYALPLDVPEAEGLPAHSALPDALVTAKLLMRELRDVEALPEGPRSLEALIAWSEEPRLLDICTFGNKHKGLPWSKVPKDYLRWMLKEVKDLDRDTRHTVMHHLG